MKCAHCGNQLGPDDHFCGECGKPVPAVAASSPPLSTQGKVVEKSAVKPQSMFDRFTKTYMLGLEKVQAPYKPAEGKSRNPIMTWFIVLGVSIIFIFLCGIVADL